MINTIENSLEKSISYQEYKNLIIDLLVQGKSTGENQTDTLLNYSKLSKARMKRLDKTFALSEKAIELIQNSTKKYSWIVLTESWCGDAAHALPIINKIAEHSENIELRIVLRDENEALMDKFLTNGSKSIPKLIAFDTETKEVIDSWGPRPYAAAKMVKDRKDQYGTLDADFKKELQVWYNENKGVNIEEEILELLCITANCL